MEVPETCLDEGEDARPRKIPKQAIRKVSKNSADELPLLRASSPGRPSRKRPEVPRKVLGEGRSGTQSPRGKEPAKTDHIVGRTAHPCVMMDLCQTRPWKEGEPFQTLHMTDLLEGELSASL
ncbi:hypothetical protein BHE74_00029205 [Ensete ventricosum]|nr:hypothetical protein GW17_00014388 [Ensete ventricosum]RWW63604.1 hypothetical protein BHE74_00029205 [Ensete ventricosum]